MNKKKIVVMMLVLVLVLSVAVTALAGCNDDDINGYSQVTGDGITLKEALGDALWNTVDQGKLNTLKASAKLTVSVNNKKYIIELNSQLALDGKGGTNFLAASFYDATAGANILNIYYSEKVNAFSSAAANETFNNMILVDIGNGDTAKHYAFNALSVTKTLADLNKSMSDEEAAENGDFVASNIEGIFQYFDLIKGMADQMNKKGTKVTSSSLYQSDNFQNLLLRIKLDRVLKNASELLQVVDGYADDLGLAISSSGLGNILPGLTADLIFKFDGVNGNNFEEATLVGVEAQLSIDKKDVKIQRTDKSTFVELNISKDLKVGVALDFGFGDKYEDYGIKPLASANTYAQNIMNTVNFEAEGELELGEAIGIDFVLQGNTHTIGVPKGKYNLKLAMDIDPFKLATAKFDFSSTSKMMDSIKGILEAVDYLKIEIENTDTSVSNASLNVTLERNAAGLQAYLTDISLLGTLGNSFGSIAGKGASIDEVLDIVQGFFPADSEGGDNNPSGNPSGTPSGNGSGNASGNGSGDNNNDDVDMEPIKILFEHLTALVNVGGNWADVTVTDHVVNSDPNTYGIVKDEGEGEDKETVPVIDTATGKQVTKTLPDTTIAVKAVVNGSGIDATATLKNVITYVDKYTKETTNDCAADLSARLQVNENGLTLTVKSAATLDGEAKAVKFSKDMSMKIDVVLKLTSFSYGTAKAA